MFQTTNHNLGHYVLLTEIDMMKYAEMVASQPSSRNLASDSYRYFWLNEAGVSDVKIILSLRLSKQQDIFHKPKLLRYSQHERASKSKRKPKKFPLKMFKGFVTTCLFSRSSTSIHLDYHPQILLLVCLLILAG